MWESEIRANEIKSRSTTETSDGGSDNAFEHILNRLNDDDSKFDDIESKLDDMLRKSIPSIKDKIENSPVDDIPHLSVKQILYNFLPYSTDDNCKRKHCNEIIEDPAYCSGGANYWIVATICMMVRIGCISILLPEVFTLRFFRKYESRNNMDTAEQMSRSMFLRSLFEFDETTGKFVRDEQGKMKIRVGVDNNEREGGSGAFSHFMYYIFNDNWVSEYIKTFQSVPYLEPLNRFILAASKFFRDGITTKFYNFAGLKKRLEILNTNANISAFMGQNYYYLLAFSTYLTISKILQLTNAKEIFQFLIGPGEDTTLYILSQLRTRQCKRSIPAKLICEQEKKQSRLIIINDSLCEIINEPAPNHPTINANFLVRGHTIINNPTNLNNGDIVHLESLIEVSSSLLKYEGADVTTAFLKTPFILKFQDVMHRCKSSDMYCEINEVCVPKKCT